MHHVKPLYQLTRDEINALAHAAAERGDELDDANVFEPGTTSHTQFRSEYLKRDFSLSAA